MTRYNNNYSSASSVTSVTSMRSVTSKRSTSSAPTVIVSGKVNNNKNNANKKNKKRSIRNLFRKKSMSGDTSCGSADGPRVRFSNSTQPDIIEYNSFKSDEEKSLMYFSKPELADITKELIALVIKECDGTTSNSYSCECNLRGLETIVEMRTLPPSQPRITELRKKYIKQIIAEYRATKRNRKLRDTIHERIRKVSEEATEKNRNDGYTLGMSDMKAAGISMVTTKNSIPTKRKTTTPVVVPSSPPSTVIQKKVVVVNESPSSPNSVQSCNDVWC